MEINTQFDVEASKIAEKIIFSCEHFELHRDDITELKKEKLVSYIQEETLPPTISCQVVIFFEPINKAKIMLFNPRFTLPQAVLDEPFLNKQLIQRSETNGWFWMEFIIPLYDDAIKLNFSYKT